MPARSKLVIKYRRRDKDMESIIEVEEIKLEEKTATWGVEEKTTEGSYGDDETRCWGSCLPVPPPEHLALDEILNWVVVAQIREGEELKIT